MSELVTGGKGTNPGSVSLRMQALARMAETAPDDPFFPYALALEHRAQGRLAESIAALQTLAAARPAYLALYYPLAEMLAEAERWTEALAFTKAGIVQAKNLDDAKSQRELAALRDRIEEEL